MLAHRKKPVIVDMLGEILEQWAKIVDGITEVFEVRYLQYEYQYFEYRCNGSRKWPIPHLLRVQDINFIEKE